MTEKKTDVSRTHKSLRILAKTLYAVALAAVVLLVASIVWMKATGVSTLTVLTPSMEPSLMTGDVILVRKTSAPIEIGSIYVGFSPEINALLAHRVIGEGAEPGTWVTKGDANPSADTYEFSTQELSQEVIGSVPFLGHITSDMTRMGVIALLFLLGGGVYFWVMHSLKEEEDGSESEDDPQVAENDSLPTVQEQSSSSLTESEGK